MKNVFENVDQNNDGIISYSDYILYVRNTTIENFDIYEMIKSHEPSHEHELIAEMDSFDQEIKQLFYEEKRKMTENFFFFVKFHRKHARSVVCRC